MAAKVLLQSRTLARAVGLCLAVFAIYTAGFGQFDPAYHRGISVAAAVLGVVLIYPLASRLRSPTSKAHLAREKVPVARSHAVGSHAVPHQQLCAR